LLFRSHWRPGAQKVPEREGRVGNRQEAVGERKALYLLRMMEKEEGAISEYLLGGRRHNNNVQEKI